ncbi:MAG: metallophosphoesterase, partial [Bacteroidetes bacterium]|nr:metallophosphoesterase [Bacteroidota bacterium]
METKHPRKEPLRFAHPFFTTVPPDKRPKVEGGHSRMTDTIKERILDIPKPIRTPQVLQLSDVVGSQDATDIENEGFITFHAVGDTGEPHGTWQETVADAMTADYDISHPASCPAFFFHLGDVDYYDNTPDGYMAQFYKPYKSYPGKILAIPGNHDGELFKYNGQPTGQTKPCEQFMHNFCQP